MKLLRLALISLVIAGILTVIPLLPGEIPSLFKIPGDILNVFWEHLLFYLTKDPYYTVGDVTPILCFLFYFILSLIVGIFIGVVRANRAKLTEGIK